MKSTHLKLFLLSTLYTCFIAPAAKAKLVSYNNPGIAYEGRLTYKDRVPELSWSGSSASISFVGTSLSAILKDSDTADYYNVIVDGRYLAKIHVDTAKRSYLLATGLSKSKHRVTLFKRTEWDKGKTLFFGFDIDDNALLLPKPTAQKRKIEFFGDSITCGYAVEDSSGRDRGIGYYENNYVSYAAITARHFDAQYSCIAKSGIGIMVSWFPLIMPEMYDRADPADPASKWNFDQYKPDVVVINLFQNDSWIVNMPDFKQFKDRLGSTPPTPDFIITVYKNFVTSIRNKYKNAAIICCLGSMDATRKGSVWPGYVTKATAQLHDPKVLTCFFDFKNTSGHPNIAEQQTMADNLIAFIGKNVKW